MLKSTCQQNRIRKTYDLSLVWLNGEMVSGNNGMKVVCSFYISHYNLMFNGNFIINVVVITSILHAITNTNNYKDNNAQVPKRIFIPTNESFIYSRGS